MPDSDLKPNRVRYRVRHTTSYRYSHAMYQAHHTAYLRPRDLDRQQVLDFTITITPTPTAIAEHTDYFGNPVLYLAVQDPHRSLVLRTEMEIEVGPPPVIDADRTPAWDILVERVNRNPESRRAGMFAYPSSLVPDLDELRDYASPSFPPGRPVAAAALDLTARIFHEFDFDSTATTISTPLTEVLKTRRGVCQDFSHLQIGCLRALGLPARYVSGYIRTVPPPGSPRLVGADATHAWVGVWCGGDDWLDVDPTNGIAGSIDFITVAWGRDYIDVSPVSGVLLGGGEQRLRVAVDVEPLPAEEETGRRVGA